jgi:hypothetical protein
MMQTLSLLLLPLITQAASAPTPLASRISAKLAGFQGHVSLFAKNLDTGQSFGILPDDPVRTASTIKLPIPSLSPPSKKPPVPAFSPNSPITPHFPFETSCT